MDLTFQVPMQYCTLQDQTLLPSPVTSTTRHCFCFGSISSFLELFLYSSPVAFWAHTNLGSSSFSVISFCLFILFMGFLWQEYWSGLLFPSPVGHILSELSTIYLLKYFKCSNFLVILLENFLYTNKLSSPTLKHNVCIDFPFLLHLIFLLFKESFSLFFLVHVVPFSAVS